MTKQKDLEIKKLLAREVELLEIKYGAQFKYEHDNKIEFFGIVDPARAEMHKDCCRLFRGANPKQKVIIDAWGNPEKQVFTLTGGNKLGKCLTYQTLIETPEGEKTIGSLYEKGEPFDVYSWNGKNRVIAKADPPFKKVGLHKCHRIEMSDGRVIEVADHHRVLTSLGWLSVLQLQAYFDNLQDSTLGIFPSTHTQDVSHLNQRQQDFPENYQACSYLCDERLPLGASNGQVSSLLRDDALGHISLSCNMGGLAYSNTCTLQPGHFPPSNLDDQCPLLARFFEFLCCASDRILSFFSPVFRLFQKPSSAEVSGLPLNPLTGLHRQFVSESSFPSLCVLGDNKIESITSIPTRQGVYDFSVPEYRNYFAGGLIHHNTTLGTVIGESLMFGYWPWDETKTPISKPPIKIRYVGQDWDNHVKTVLQPALEKWWPKNRLLETKKNNQGVKAYWKDEQTGSTLELMSNKQEVDVFEGWDGHFIIYDEPPRREIRIACARGLAVTNGRELFTATLLKEAWVHREVIKAKNEDGTPDLSVFNVHGEIYDNLGFGLTEEGIESFAKKLTKEERQSRLRGIPSYMAGLIYPEYDANVHLKERFKIPLDWIVDIAIDCHPAKENAVSFMATDPRNYKYLIDEIWDYGDGTEIGEAIVRIVTSGVYRVNIALIDYSAKGDSNNTFTTYEKIETVLSRYGISLDTYKKDEDGGIKSARTLLKSPNNEPALFIFDDLARTIYEIEGYMVDPKTHKPQNYDNDMMDNLYALANEDTQWSSPTPKRRTSLPANWKVA